MGIAELGGVLAIILGLASVGTSPAPAPTLSRIGGEANPWGSCIVTEDVRLVMAVPDEVEEPSAEQLLQYREGQWALFGLTSPPPRPVRIAGEFEPAAAMLLAYKAFDEYDDIFGDLIEFGHEQGVVQVLVEPAERRRFDSLLQRRRIARGRVQVISDVPHDTVWMRDFGPQAVITGEGLGFVDGRYFLNCLDDDLVPTMMAAHLGSDRVYRPDLWTEGGNLLSNGEGLCVTTNYLAQQNQRTERRIAEQLLEYYGCERTLFLEPMTGNVVSHVDMFMYFADEDVVLLGQFTEDQDPLNSAILEANFRRLSEARTRSGRPLTILRVPMPDLRPSTIDDEDGPLVRSYLNMLAFNDVVMVPVYDDERRGETEALAAIQVAFPDRFVVPIPVDLMAPDNGTIHCITQTVPVVVESAAAARRPLVRAELRPRPPR